MIIKYKRLTPVPAGHTFNKTTKIYDVHPNGNGFYIGEDCFLAEIFYSNTIEDVMKRANSGEIWRVIKPTKEEIKLFKKLQKLHNL